MKVLIVDDDRMNTDILEEFFEDYPGENVFQLKACNFSVEAVLEIENIAYDLIVLDVMMPGINGIDILKKIKKSLLNTNTPVIMQSASVIPEHKESCYHNGAYFYLTKPYSFNNFVDAVDKILFVRNNDE